MNIRPLIEVMLPSDIGFKTGGNDINLDEKILFFLKTFRLPTFPLKMIFFIFNLLPLLTFFSMKTFNSLPYHKREWFLRRCENSNFAFIRLYLLLLKVIIFTTFYSDKDVLKQINYKTDCIMDKERKIGQTN